MNTFFFSFIFLWVLFAIAFLSIGGYFMFRKFLKVMPKKDGMSDMDWQEHYIDRTRHLWDPESLQLLDELVQPVPELFRDVAKRSIAAKIGKLALDEGARSINMDIIIRGYITATPARDHKWLIKHLREKEIDYSAYEHMLKINV